MDTERKIRAFAGLLITISLGLGYFLNEKWYLITLFVGVSLLQSAFTNVCPAECFFQKTSNKKEELPD